MFCIFHDLHGGSVTVHFDNDAGLDKAAVGNPNVPMMYKHSDLVWAIWTIVSKLWTEHTIEVTFMKGKGHRANLVPFDQLTHPEQLNEMMDT